MFYKAGVDITNDKQMFAFLKNHFTYYTMNSWNGVRSIANNVKLYKLGLSGDWTTVYNLLSSGEYDTISETILVWEYDHPGFEISFNGRSGGYLVLRNKCNNYSVLPDEIDEAEDYDEYKRICKNYFGSVKANRPDLVYYTKLVQDFDKLCDTLRDFCDELSTQSFELVEMQKAVEQFNDRYVEDLEYLGFDFLRCEENGEVDISEISELLSLCEAFMKIADRRECGYVLTCKDGIAKLVK